MAIFEAKAGIAELKLWHNGFKLDNGGTGAAAVWEKDGTRRTESWSGLE